jgi:hypothetical protein
VILKLGTGGGAKLHRVNSAGVAISSSLVSDYRSQAYLRKVQWTIEFRLINSGTSAVDLDAGIAEINGWYAAEYDAIALLHDNSATTAHSISSATGLIGKIRTTSPPSYARWQNGEYVSYRTGSVTVEAMESVGPEAGRIIEFSQRIDFSGGGAEVAYLQPNVGFPTGQTTRTNTPFNATQSGRIVHWDGYGSLPAPIWPAALIAAPKVTLENPTYNGAAAFNYPQSYTYTFQSASALTL